MLQRKFKLLHITFGGCSPHLTTSKDHEKIHRYQFQTFKIHVEFGEFSKVMKRKSL